MTINEPLTEDINTLAPYDIFEKHPDSKYWIGKVNKENSPLYYDAIGRFRANVYIKQMRFLDEEKIDDYGREYDEYDKHSEQFAVIENLSINHQSNMKARVVGYGRMILKENIEVPLPIENQFTNVFKHNPAKIGAVEVSRFISRHENDLVQHTIGLSVIRAMTHCGAEKDIEIAYFEIERPLLRILKRIGLPLVQLEEPQSVNEPGGVRQLYPIAINPYEILDSVTTDLHSNYILRDFFIQESSNSGTGYYPEELVGGTL